MNIVQRQCHIVVQIEQILIGESMVTTVHQHFGPSNGVHIVDATAAPSSLATTTLHTLATSAANVDHGYVVAIATTANVAVVDGLVHL